MSFSDQIKKAREKMVQEADEHRKAVTIKLFGAVIKDTPFVSGRLRGNWQTNEGSPKQGELERLDPTGSEALNEAVSTVNQTNQDSVVHLTNNLPYAVPMENQTAMLAKNMARIEQIVRSKQ